MSGSFLLFGQTPAATPRIGVLRAAGRIFEEDGLPWRYMGFSCFPACALFQQGRLGELDAILDDYAGCTVMRVWDYVPWLSNGWDSSDAATWIAFLAYVRARGLRVELTPLTDDDPRRLDPARRLVQALAGCDNLLIEIGNEPTTHKLIDTSALRNACLASGLPFSSGNYEDSRLWFGTYGTAHTPRTFDYARRAHDLMEYYNGGGPNSPSDPACRAPWVADEPMKLQDVPGSLEDKIRGWRAYFGACALLGAGATFHSETGKFGQRPTSAERQLLAAALDGLRAFPADAPRGLDRGEYTRVVEPGNEPGGPTDYARTYVVGTRYAVRCQQVGLRAPGPGFTMLDADGVLWQR